MNKYIKNKQIEKKNDDTIYYQDYENLVFKEKMKIRLEIEGLTHDAKGIAKVKGYLENGEEINNFPIFVNGVLPKEKVLVEITKMHSSYAEARLIEIRYHNYDDREINLCKEYHACGGCNIMHMKYDAQLRFKRQSVIDTLAKIGGIKDIEVDEIVKMDNPSNYRNKVQVPYHFTKGKTICGFYKKNTHEVVSLADCKIQSNLASDIVKFIRNICNELKIKGYDETTHTGMLRHVMVRENKKQDEVMVVLVTKERKIPNQDILIKKLLARYPNITSLIQNINGDKTNVVLGKENITLMGNDYIIDELLDVKFKIGPLSFYQVNTKQTEKLYSIAIEKANLTQNDILIDAYCGIGTIGLIASKFVNKVYGVEIVEEAIANAKENMKLNKIKNATFVANKAEEQIIKWFDQKIKPTTIFVDPPRKGCDEAFLNTIIKMEVNKIIYVSCNPATLARDLKKLLEADYVINSITPVDMFPNSNHCECVVKLSSK